MAVWALFENSSSTPKPAPSFQTQQMAAPVPPTSYRQGAPIFTTDYQYFTIPQVIQTEYSYMLFTCCSTNHLARLMFSIPRCAGVHAGAVLGEGSGSVPAELWGGVCENPAVLPCCNSRAQRGSERWTRRWVSHCSESQVLNSNSDQVGLAISRKPH